MYLLPSCPPDTDCVGFVVDTLITDIGVVIAMPELEACPGTKCDVVLALA
jgi:hypothetical protein